MVVEQQGGLELWEGVTWEVGPLTVLLPAPCHIVACLWTFTWGTSLPWVQILLSFFWAELLKLRHLVFILTPNLPSS